MYGADFCHTHGEVHPEAHRLIRESQWFAFYEGVHFAAQHREDPAAVDNPFPFPLMSDVGGSVPNHG